MIAFPDQEVEENPLDDSSSLQQERILQEDAEREELLQEMNSAKQHSEAVVILAGYNQNDESYEDELTIATIASLIEKGDEIEISDKLGNSLAASTVRITKDKAKARKSLQNLIEVLSALENAVIQSPDTRLKKHLASYREQLVKYYKTGEIDNMPKLQNSLLPVNLVTHAVLQVRALQANNAAERAATLPAELKQALQNSLREVYTKTRQAHEALSQKITEVAPQASIVNVKQIQLELAKQAKLASDTTLLVSNAPRSAIQQSLKKLENSSAATLELVKTAAKQSKQFDSITPQLEARQVIINTAQKIASVEQSRQTAKATVSQAVDISNTRQPVSIQSSTAQKPVAQDKAAPAVSANIHQLNITAKPQTAEVKPVPVKNNIVAFENFRQPQVFIPTPIIKPEVKTIPSYQPISVPEGKFKQAETHICKPGCGCKEAEQVKEVKAKVFTPMIVPEGKAKAPEAHICRPGCGCKEAEQVKEAKAKVFTPMKVPEGKAKAPESHICKPGCDCHKAEQADYAKPKTFSKPARVINTASPIQKQQQTISK